MNSCHKKSILVTRNHFLSQEINSCQKKSILVKRNQFLSQEINSCCKKFFLVSSNSSVKLTLNLRQRVNPTKNFAWAQTFRGNLVPRFPGNSPPCFPLTMCGILKPAFFQCVLFLNQKFTLSFVFYEFL